MNFSSFNLWYCIGLLTIPGILGAVYYLKGSYFIHSVITGAVLLFILIVLDPYPFWIYGGIVVSFALSAYFAFLMGRYFIETSQSRSQEINLLTTQLEASCTDTQKIKNAINHKEKDIERSIYMYSIIKGLAETINWKTMVPVIGRALKRFFNTTEYALYLVGEDDVFRAYHRTRGWPARISSTRVLSVPMRADPAWADGLQSGEVISPDAVAIPFLNKDQLFGILLLLPKKDPQTHDQSDLLGEAESLQTQLLFGMERAKLYHDIEVRSLIDGLTRLYRRQYFDLKSEDEIIRAQSFNTKVAFAMIDADHFKQINDTYGHQTGDEVLARLGALCKSHVYETDFCARYGGEEFVIICPRAEREGLMRKMEGLRKKIESEQFVAGGTPFSVTVSIGIAHFPQDGTNKNELIAAADRALYAAKDAGRNTIKEFENI